MSFLKIDQVEIVRKADAIFREELEKDKSLWDSVWQAFVGIFNLKIQLSAPSCENCRGNGRLQNLCTSLCFESNPIYQCDDR